MGGSPISPIATPSTLNSGATGADVAKHFVDPSTRDAYSRYTEGDWRVAKKGGMIWKWTNGDSLLLEWRVMTITWFVHVRTMFDGFFFCITTFLVYAENNNNVRIILTVIKINLWVVLRYNRLTLGFFFSGKTRPGLYHGTLNFMDFTAI